MRMQMHAARLMPHEVQFSFTGNGNGKHADADADADAGPFWSL